MWRLVNKNNPAGKNHQITTFAGFAGDQLMLCFGAGLCWFFQQGNWVRDVEQLMYILMKNHLLPVKDPCVHCSFDIVSLDENMRR